MIQPEENSRRQKPKKPAARQTKAKAKTSPSASWTLNGKNVVGPIEARGQAQVNIHQNIREYTPLSEDEEKRRKQKSELKELENAIERKQLDWQRLVAAPLPKFGNPYLFMQPFGFADGPRFFARHGILQELLVHLTFNSTTFLDGIGKTSLLQAGLVPTLSQQGHLPLLISASGEPLETSIKKQLLPNIGDMEFLLAMSLTEFVRRVSDQLADRQLFLLIDQFEDFFDQSETFRHAFIEAWKLCVSGSAPDVHWLFSIPGGSTYLLNLFKEKVAINPNLITLQPLQREEARQAMLGQAALREIEIEETVANVILDDLDHLKQSVVDPAQLQLVCYMLAGGQGQLVKKWTMANYQAQGGVDGILANYLDRTISNLEPVNREPAWQLLATLIDPVEKAGNESELIEKMKQLNIDEQKTRGLLKYLEESHLVEFTTGYKLSSEGLRPSIQDWLDQRAAAKKVREEVKRQTHNIRRSALRGLFGGALGFILAYWILPYPERLPITDPLFYTWYAFNLGLRGLLGAFSGFFMIIEIDLILASFQRRSHWRLLAGMFAGASAFSLALVFHIGLHYSGAQFLTALERAALTGALWGLPAGAGAIWLLTTERWVWPGFLGICLLCGLTLMAGNSLIQGLDVDAQPYSIFISGMLMPLCLVGSALWGGPKIRKDGQV